MLFVECAPGGALGAGQVMEACRGLASYARPGHVEIVPAGSLPLNRVAKTDYLALRERAREIVAGLRAEGGWDARG